MTPEMVEKVLTQLGGFPLTARTKVGRIVFYRLMMALHRMGGVPAGVRTVVTSRGARFECDLADNVQAQLFYTGSYSEREISAISSAVRTGEVFVDVGAHIGLFSTTLALQMDGPGGVIAFEPAHDTCMKLRRHIRANGVEDRVDVREHGLWDKSSTLSLRGQGGEVEDSALRSLVRGDAVLGQVAVHAFDELVNSGEIDLQGRVGAVKIDVEGGELHVLKGMEETLRQHEPRILVIETESQARGVAGESHVRGIDAFMKSAGYMRAGRLRRRNTLYVRA